MTTYLVSHDVLGYRCETFEGKRRVATTAWYKTVKRAKQAIKRLVSPFANRS